MEDICKEKHKRIDEKFDTHERRLNNHGERIDALEQFKSSTETEIKNLIEQIKSLVVTMRWFMGLMVGTLLGFFIWYIQRL
jgi:F0F1-type ATP synthase assembly protein I